MKHTIHEFELTGGIKGLLIDVPGSSVFNLAAVFNSGNIFGTPAKFEVPHVMEHLMGCGTRTYPSAKLFKTEVEKNGAYRNASTSPLTNEYIYECADFELERIIGLLCSHITEPLLPQESFAAELSNVREELSRNVSNYSRVAYMLLASQTMSGMALPDDVRITQLPTITHQDILDHYRRTHTANNLRLFVSGDLKGRQGSTMSLLEAGLDKMATGQRLEVPVASIKPPKGPIQGPRDIPQIYYYLHMHAAYDYTDRAALILLTQLFTGGHRSWVFGEARERGLAYAVFSGSTVAPHTQYISFMSNVTPANSRPLFELIAAAVRRATDGDFTDSELAAVKTRQVGRLLRSHQTPGDMLDWYADDYNAWDSINHFDDFIKAMHATSREDIVRVARKLVDARQWGLSLVGDITKKRADDLHKTIDSIWK